MKTAQKKDIKKAIVFFDFDNTISAYDILDDMLVKFSVNDAWVDLERRWKRGEIGSRECLRGQIGGIRIKKRRFDKYLSTITLDRYFLRLIRYLDSKKIETIIISDNFDYILNAVLKNKGASNLKVYSNKLEVRDDRLIPSFPFADKKCGECAHCKKGTIKKHTGRNSMVFYVGDGLSDVCASRIADVIFAKSYLRRYLEEKDIVHIPFNGLKDVYENLKRRLP